MRIKTSDLIGAPLDWAVAKCEGTIPAPGAVYAPSTNWGQGGPIIEAKNIEIRRTFNVSCEGSFSDPEGWAAVRHTYGGAINPPISRGNTALIAAMRCYVLSKLGREVDIPDELI